MFLHCINMFSHCFSIEGGKDMATKKEQEIVDDKTAVDEKLIAEVKMLNASKELDRLKDAISRSNAEIAAKENEIKTLQSDHEDARLELANLYETGERLANSRRNAENRAIIVKGTPDETDVHLSLSSILQQIEQHRLFEQAARTRRDMASSAISNIAEIQEEIVRLQKEREKYQVQYNEMEPLHREQYERIGLVKMQELQAKITEQESIILSLEEELTMARRELKSTQLSISKELFQWPKNAELLQKTHGYVPEPQSPTKKALVAWKNFIDVLRDEPIPVGVHVSDTQTLRIHEFLSITPQDFVYFAQASNWHERIERDHMGHDRKVFHNQRYDMVLAAIERYK
jgi:hypothetical protein